jgi:hypothetical protein
MKDIILIWVLETKIITVFLYVTPCKLVIIYYPIIFVYVRREFILPTFQDNQSVSYSMAKQYSLLKIVPICPEMSVTSTKVSRVISQKSNDKN